MLLMQVGIVVRMLTKTDRLLASALRPVQRRSVGRVGSDGCNGRVIQYNHRPDGRFCVV
jgi:hypothetical protein